MTTLFPSTFAIVLLGLLAIANLENQRWVRALMNGLVGSNQVAVAFIQYSGTFSAFFAIAFIASFTFQHGWMAGLGLIAVACVVHNIWKFTTRPNIFPFWVIGTLALWPLMALLAWRTNWFGAIN